MGMTRDEFKILVKSMKAVYPQATFIPDNDAFSVWYELLKDIDYKPCAMAIQRYMSTEKFPPTIADIRENAFKNTQANEMSEAEAWSLVRKAIGNSSYNAESEFENLPLEIQKSIGSPSQLRNWARDEDYNDGVVQSQFLRSYRQVCERKREFSKMPSSIKNLIQTTERKMIGGE